MTKYSQAGRWLKLRTPLGEDALLLEGFQGAEAVSELFRFEIDALAPPGVQIPFEKLLAQPVSVALEQGEDPPRYFHGIVESIEEQPPGEEFNSYKLVMVPRFWLLTRRVQSRIFQQQSVPDILRTVLKGLDVVVELEDSYAPHNYCVQYQESDFAFASRLMEEVGIFYYFRHGEEGHPMVLADRSANGPALSAQGRVAFDRVHKERPAPGRIHDWRKRQNVRSTRLTLRDYSLAVPAQNLEATHRCIDEVTAGDVAHSLQASGGDDFELFNFSGGYAHRVDVIDPAGAEHSGEASRLFEEAKQTARVRMEEETAGAVSIAGAGTCGHFTPGYRFTLAGLSHADGPYWLRKVEHAARTNSYRSGNPEADRDYTNRFICLPEALPYRPERSTPLPRPKLQTAVVVGVPGEEITTDKYGRIKVHFRWDRQAPGDHRSSCWLRIAQPWSGKGWGMTTLPRVGQEVVVDFLDGDPDGPLVIGSVYNNEQMPPFNFPNERTRSGVKAQTAGAGGDPSLYSGVGFETQSGSELVAHPLAAKSLRHRERDAEAKCRHQQELARWRFGSQVVGGLQTTSQSSSSTSSGQGGGSEGAVEGSSSTSFYGSLSSYSGIEFGSFCSWVVGNQASNTLGTQFANSINPLSATEVVDLPIGETAAKYLAGVTGGMGLACVNVGAVSTIAYGPNVSIQRGPTFQYTRSRTWGGEGSSLCKGLLSCFILAEVGQSFMLAQVADSDAFTGDDFAYGAYTSFTQLLYAACLVAETWTLTAEFRKQLESEAAVAITTTTPPTQTEYTEVGAYAFVLGMAVAILGEMLVVGAIGTSGQGSGGGSGEPVAGELEPASHVNAHQVPYQLSATTVVLQRRR